MRFAISVPWLGRLATCLDADNAKRAIEAATELLAEVGALPVLSGEPPALSVEYAGHRLAFSRGALDDETLVGAKAMLRAALRRVAEQDALESARERMNMLASASFEGIFIHVDGSVIDANPRFCEMLGRSYEEILGAETLRRCVAPEDLPLVLELVRNRYEGAYVVTGVRADGSRFRAELLSKQGKLGARPVRVVAVRDVTDRERTHALLSESESRLSELAEEVFDVIVLSRG
ncbi:MAG TPA: PAS domain S-box protein, partial [Polyangiaceae bacterium]|nr:PAS domain S-box protein [Polyangiaceae bacterium]